MERERIDPRWPLLVALVGALVYLTALGNGFALDDVPLVRDNPSIRSVSDLPRLFTQGYWDDTGSLSAGLYRPLAVASLAINRAVTGPGAFGFHLANLLLHAAASALAWFVARRVGLAYGTALAAGLLFAVHPLHVEAVANIAGRAELLAAVGVFGAWLLHGRARVLAALVWGTALLSKESALLAPLVFLADDRHRERDGARPAGWAAYAGYFAVFVAVLIARSLALDGLRGAETTAFIDNPAAAQGTLGRIGTALWVLARYAFLFVWPVRLSGDYSFDAIPVVNSAGDLRWLAGLAVVAALVGLGWHGWRRSRPLFVGAVATAFMMLPASNLAFPTGTLMAERLAYLPSFGPCLMAGHAVAALAGRAGLARAGRMAVVAVFAAALLASAARTWTRNPVWKNNLTLSLRDLEVQPRSAKLWMGAAIGLHSDGRLAEAETHYREALAIYPDYAQAHYNLGELLAATDRPAEAERALVRAVELASANPRPYKALARLRVRLGRVDEALEAYAAGAARDPGDFRFRFDHGRLLLSRDRWAEAVQIFAGVADEDQGGLWGGVSAALVADWRGRPDEAVARLDGLLRRNDVSEKDRAEIRRLREALAARGG